MLESNFQIVRGVPAAEIVNSVEARDLLGFHEQISKIGTLPRAERCRVSYLLHFAFALPTHQWTATVRATAAAPA